jgi:hypothetical protein
MLEHCATKDVGTLLDRPLAWPGRGVESGVVMEEGGLELENPNLEMLREGLERAKGRGGVGGLEWAKRTGEMWNMTWRESQWYLEWLGLESKDKRLTFRISGTDMMKIKALARMKGKRYMTYVREIVIREIRNEEERLAKEG